jgi:hypothetical protein
MYQEKVIIERSRFIHEEIGYNENVKRTIHRIKIKIVSP